MEDSRLFLQWAMSTLRQEQLAAAINDECSSEATFPSLQALREASHAAEMVQELIAEARANSWSSSDTTDGSNSNSSAPAAVAVAMDHDVWPVSQTSASRRASSGTSPPVTWNWNFSAAAASAQLGLGSDGIVPESAPNPKPALPKDEEAYGSPPARRAVLKSPAGSMSPAPYPQDHIIAERKRREKINQRFMELTAVIPGLKKINKATILSDATKYVKELQGKLKDLESGGSNGRKSIETVVLVKRPCLHAPDDDGSPLLAWSGTPAERKPLPEIEARFSEKSVMVRIHCEDGKGVAVKVLAEVEELHLSIIHANVLPFAVGTLIITFTAKVEEGFIVTTEEIVGRLNSALLHTTSQHIIDAATALLMSDEETIN